MDAVVIYLRGIPTRQALETSLSPRDPRQPWIMLSFEAPPLANSVFRTDYRSLNAVFNRTMFYRKDSDVIVPHGFVVRRGTDSALLPDQWHVQPVLNSHKTSRKLAVTFISNCKDVGGRLSYIHELQQHMTVDVYGKCGHLKCGKSMYVEHRYDPTKEKCLRMAGMNYLFYFSFENSLCKDYITEKLYNVLYYPIVPVVYGAGNYSSVLPPHSYIDARQYSPFKLARKLLHLADTPKVNTLKNISLFLVSVIGRTSQYMNIH